MSKVKIQGNASGTGTLTISAPNTNTDRTLTLPDTAGEFVTADASGNVGIGTSSPAYDLEVNHSTAENATIVAKGSAPGIGLYDTTSSATNWLMYGGGDNLKFFSTPNTNGFNSVTERMRIDSAGRVTMPYQPAFMAGSNSSVVTLSGGTVLPFNLISFNIGNHFNTSTSTFTAPIAGRYLFTFQVYNNSNNQASVTLVVNGTEVDAGSDKYPFIFIPSGMANNTHTSQGILNLNANDAVKVQARSGYSAQLYMGHSGFSGILLS